ncbi:MAG: 16S rRNA (uracil(1498)-N(3))-methyltransferase [Verrucomicrobia bacterium]|nr:16S rRNA (uracil(1498)-N(3))-methyltransferase [Verrucomicrobiota bacterium]
MNLILITPRELDEAGKVRLTDQRAKHIRSVLKPEIGKELRIGLLNGPLGKGAVEEVSSDSVMLACAFEAEPPPRPSIDLLLAMPRPKVLKRLWAQFAALGVGRIILTNAEKVERFYFDTHVLDPDFYNARFIEGLQQARDTRLPDVTVVKNLKPFLERETFSAIGKKLIADPSGTRSLFQCLETGRVEAQRILLAIGPEGGWTPYELELFKAHGFDLFSMGPRILRTDTACIALISQLTLLSGSNEK